MNSILVLGIGNRLFGDDDVGNEVVGILSETNTDMRIQYLVGETDIDYCSLYLFKAQPSMVFLIDAVQTGKPPGCIHIFSLNDLKASVPSGITMHDQHLYQTVNSGKFCGMLIGIEPYDLSYRIGLSEPLKRDLPKIIEFITDTIQTETKKLQEKLPVVSN